MIRINEVEAKYLSAKEDAAMMVVTVINDEHVAVSVLCFLPDDAKRGVTKDEKFQRPSRLQSTLRPASSSQQGAAALISPGPAADTASRYYRLLMLMCCY